MILRRMTNLGEGVTSMHRTDPGLLRQKGKHGIGKRCAIRLQIDQRRCAVGNRNKACVINATFQASCRQFGFYIHNSLDGLMPVIGTCDQKNIFTCIAARLNSCPNLGKTRIGGGESRQSRRRPNWRSMLACIGLSQP